MSPARASDGVGVDPDATDEIGVQVHAGARPRADVHAPPASHPIGPAEAVLRFNPQAYLHEGVGAAVRWVGGQVSAATGWLDQTATENDLPQPLEVVMGVTAGATGFVGDTLEGVGGLVETVGKLERGDPATVRQVLELGGMYLGAQAYAGGSALERAGEQLEDLGGSRGWSLLQQAGHDLAELGLAEQSLASEQARQLVEVSHEAEKYALGLGLSGLGESLDILGWDGSELQTVARDLQEGNADNPVVKALQNALAERSLEYQENGWYAMPRDGIRAILEVGSLFVGPESLLGKAGSAGRTGRAALESAELLQKGAQIGSRHSDDATRAARLLSPDDVQTIQNGIDRASQGWILGPDDFGTFSSYADLQAAFPNGTIPLQALRPHEPGWNTGSSVWWSLGDPESPVRVVLVDEKIYTADGANRVSAAIALGRDSVPYTLGAAPDEAFVREVLARFQVPSSYQSFRDYYHHVPQYGTR